MHYIGRRAVTPGTAVPEGGGKQQAADESAPVPDDDDEKRRRARSKMFLTSAAAETGRKEHSVLQKARDLAVQDKNRMARDRASGKVPTMMIPIVPMIAIGTPGPNGKPRLGSAASAGGTSQRMVSSRYAGVRSSGYGTPSARGQSSSRLTGYDSSRPPPGFNSQRVGPGSARSSLATNISSARLNRAASRSTVNRMPSVDEIAQALRERPHLSSQICTIRDDKSLDKQRKMWEIAKVINDGDALPPEPTALEKVQAEYLPTPEQKAGRRLAAREQIQRLKAAEKQKIELMAHPRHSWEHHGGAAIDKLLEHVTLVDAHYLVSLDAHGGTLPRWQHLPESARISRSNSWRLHGWDKHSSLGILVLSCPWLDQSHPDKEGEQLRRIVPVLKEMLNLCGGDAFTIGVLWDHASLPQPARSKSEEARFRMGLLSLMGFYMHPYTHVLLMTSALPTGADYTNRRPYDQRGWCELEKRAAYVAKDRLNLWDIGGFEPEQLEKKNEKTGAPLFTPAQRYDVLRNMLMLKPGVRSPPIAPPYFATMLRQQVKAKEITFSEPLDMELVIEMYERGFITFFESYRSYDISGRFGAYQGAGWVEDEARVLAASLAFAAEKCKLRKELGPMRINLEGNYFEEAGKRQLAKAIQFSKVFSGLAF